MSNPTPAYYQDIDPKKERPEGVVNRTERNPEGRMQFQSTATTPFETPEGAEEGQSLAAVAMMQKSRAIEIARKVEALLTANPAHYVPLFEDLLKPNKAS